MADPKSDPSAEKDLLPILKRDEHLLWAGRRSKPGRAMRWGTYIWSAIYISLTTAAIVYRSVEGVILISVMLLPTLYLRDLAGWFVTYGITDKRFYIVRRLPPRSWEELNLVDWDTSWVRFGTGKSRIHLSYFGRTKLVGWWRHPLQPLNRREDMENIPELEAVRELLLRQIGSSERLDEDTQAGRKRKPRKPVISGTMTG